jgi:trigger factor
MNITKESTGELTASLKVEVREEDYLDKVNKILKDYQRKANVPGFRPGKVPFGMVKKMYGTAVMADEVNKLVSEQLTAYLRENEIKMLGYPIPNDEKTGLVDWNTQSSFDLFFDVGLAPEFELNFSKEVEVDYYKIKVSDEQVEEEVKRLSQQHGKMEKTETSEEQDWVDGTMVQLDDNGNALENGINTESYIYPPSIKTDEQKARFIGLKADDSVEFDIRELFPENKDIARLLKVTEKEAASISGHFKFTVKEISRMIPAEMNEEFFAKVFPGQEIADEEAFRKLIAEHMEKNYSGESDKKFLQDAVDKLMELNIFSLPEDFLKRWMLESNRGEVSAEEIEKDFPNLSKSLKWDLVKQKIAKQHSIRVTDEDLENYVKAYFTGRFGQAFEEDDERMNDLIKKVLSKEEDTERIEADIFNARLLQVMKEQLNLNIKELSVEDFITLVGAKHDHDHDHHHGHDHDHDHDHVHDHNCDHDHDHDHEGHHHH